MNTVDLDSYLIGKRLRAYHNIRLRIKNHNLNIEWVDWGIGFRVNDTIVLNKDLLLYPRFASEVVEHELKHSSNYNYKDLWYDFSEGDMIKNIKFALKHPRAFMMYVPLHKYKGEWHIDISMIIIYIFIFFMLWIIL